MYLVSGEFITAHVTRVENQASGAHIKNVNR